jgi:hypothetical protein
MSSIARPRPVCALRRFARSLTRALVFVLRVVIVGLSMGVARPSFVVKAVRHEDPIVQVADEEVP